MKATAAIIVAGGQGVRFGGAVRKQYLTLNGRPVLWWSLQAFQKSPSISSIILVVPVEDRSRIERQARRWKLPKLFAVVPGGATRADSVREGLKQVPKGTKWVAIHDAVRPLITPVGIERVVAAAIQKRAALLAIAGRDTVKLADSRMRVASSPDRERVWLAQTPQVFERKIIEKAHAKGRRWAVTDDSQLVERLGVPVTLVPSPDENFKVTVPSDLVMARWVLALRRKGKH